jgi:hypothetical protein
MRLPLHAAARRGTGNVSTTRAPLRAGTRDVLAAGPRRAAARDFTLLGLPLLAASARSTTPGGRLGRTRAPLWLYYLRRPYVYVPWRSQGGTAPCFFGACHANAFLQFHTALATSTCAHEELESPFGNGGSLKRNQAYYRSSGSCHKMQ